MLVGLGKADAAKLDTFRKAGATIARSAKKEKAVTLGIGLPVWNNDAASTTQVITEGILLALHQDNRFKSEVEDKNKLLLNEVHLLDSAGNDAAIAKAQGDLRWGDFGTRISRRTCEYRYADEYGSDR